MEDSPTIKSRYDDEPVYNFDNDETEEKESTKSVESEDLVHFENRVKDEITQNQMKKFHNRCDKGIMKSMFLVN